MAELDSALSILRNQLHRNPAFNLLATLRLRRAARSI